jgi:hypothetical protein
MKLNPIRLANAIGGATAILFPLCAVFAYTARDFLLKVFESMFHSIDVTPLTTNPGPPFELGRFVLGWAVVSAYVWFGGLIGGTIYNIGLRNGGPR